MRRVGPVWIVAAACVVSYGGIGLLLIQHRPRNMAGWMLLGVGMLLSFLSYGPGLISVVGLSLWMPWLGNDTVWFSLAILLVDSRQDIVQ